MTSTSPRRLGFSLPQFGEIAARPDAVTRFAREAEQLGVDSLWAGDRLLSPTHPSVGYGGGAAPIPEQYKSVLDPFAALAAAAAVTSRPLLGTSVLNAPFYPPATLGRALTSIDVISGGRLLPGLGIGWQPEEFESVGMSIRQRGVRLDECVDALTAWWTGDPVEHHGAHWDIPSSHVELKPAQVPRPPIYLGGYADVALRRVALRGDGWLPAGVIPGRFDPEGYVADLGRIRAWAAEAGRDPDAIDAILRINPVPPSTPGDIVDAVLRAYDAGLDHVFVELMYLTADVEESLEIVATVCEGVTQRSSAPGATR